MKFKDLSTGIQCDLNINDQLGTINTSLIRHYCDILPILRPLLHAIKKWARPLGYNSPASTPGKSGKPITFSSYTLTIMTIGLLQVLFSYSAFHIFGANQLPTCFRQGVCCQICKKVPNLRKVEHSGYGRTHKEGFAVMLGGRKYSNGRLPGWSRLNRRWRTGFSTAEPSLFLSKRLSDQEHKVLGS